MKIKRYVPLLGLLFAFQPLSAEALEEAPLLVPTPKMQTETRYLVHSLEQLHYLNKTLSEIDAQEFLKNYMSDLDFNRLFFLRSDITGFQDRFANSITLYLRQQGNLYPAFEIFETYRDRVNNRIEWIEKRLEEDFDFTQDDTYTPDRHEEDWPETIAETDDLWTRRLKYELLNEMLSSKAFSGEQTDQDTEEDTEAKSEQEIYEEQLGFAKENVLKRYKRIREALEEIEAFEVEEIFLSSFTHMYDPHSSFMSADTLEEFSIALRNSLVGIGAVLAVEDGYCVIRELMTGGPAERSKQLNPTDKIVGVSDGNGEMVDVIGMKLRKIVKLIRGKEGTEIRLLIQPADGDPTDRKEVILKRGTIKLTFSLAQAEFYEIEQGETTVPIGVISLPTFYGPTDMKGESASTTRNVEELIDTLKRMNIEGLIVDLRGNGGGLLEEAIDLTGLFIPSGPVVQVKDTVGQVNERIDRDKKISWNGPMIVLVSRHSASASEIFAGALKNHKRALIVGETSTHGKGTVQVLFEMDRSLFSRRNRPKMGAAKVTIQKFYLPDGSSTQRRGVLADIAIPSINDHLPIGEDDLPNALPWDSIDPVKWDYSETIDALTSPIDEELLATLSLESQRRQESLPEFNYLERHINYFKEKQERKTYSLNFEERKEKLKKENEHRNAMKEELKALAENNFESQEILLAVAEKQKKDKEAIKKAMKKAKDAADEEAGKAKKEELPSLDIYLRESLRIMADWINTIQQEEGSNTSSLVQNEPSNIS